MTEQEARVAERLWQRLDKMIDDNCEYHKQLAKRGKHNLGVCRLCGNIHYADGNMEVLDAK